MDHLFVYGTLLFPEILHELTGKLFKTKKVRVAGFKRYKVKEEDYPAVIWDRNSFVDGVLVFNVDKRSIDILSFYEGPEYEIKEIDITTENDTIKAYIFVWKEGLHTLENNDWDEDFFKKHALPIYKEKIIPGVLKEFKMQ